MIRFTFRATTINKEVRQVYQIYATKLDVL